jgi:hypothetical protein
MAGNRFRRNETVLGRRIGTSSGWEQADDWLMILIDYEPAPGISLPIGDLCIDFQKGQFSTFDDAGRLNFVADIVTILSPLERAA